MRSRVLLTPHVAAGTLAAPTIVASPFQPADAQAWGDKDRDGVPNAVDPQNNNRRPNQAWGDKDRDGVPNAVVPDNNNRRFQ